MTRHFHHGWNTPGYLPEAEIASTFLEFENAKASLLSDLALDADAADEAAIPSMAEAISASAEDVNLWNDLAGDFEWVTHAVSDEPHDLGTAYWLATCFEHECVTDEHLEDWLGRDGDLSVPCSRYGRTTKECAPVAVALLRIFEEANGNQDEPLDALNEFMGYVVNDSDQPEELILGHCDDDLAAVLLGYLTNRYLSEWIPEPGGSNLIALMDDGGSLCEACVRDPESPVHRSGDSDGWRIEAWTLTADLDQPDACDHCAKILS